MSHTVKMVARTTSTSPQNITTPCHPGHQLIRNLSQQTPYVTLEVVWLRYQIGKQYSKPSGNLWCELIAMASNRMKVFAMLSVVFDLL